MTTGWRKGYAWDKPNGRPELAVGPEWKPGYVFRVKRRSEIGNAICWMNGYGTGAEVPPRALAQAEEFQRGEIGGYWSTPKDRSRYANSEPEWVIVYEPSEEANELGPIHP